MTHYRSLEAWKRAMDLVVEVYRATETFPHYEMHGLAAQLRKAAASVPSNIAEGEGRHSRRESQQFLRHARGSMFEAETQLLIAQRVGYIDDDTTESILNLSSEAGKLLNGLLRYYRRRDRTRRLLTPDP